MFEEFYNKMTSFISPYSNSTTVLVLSASFATCIAAIAYIYSSHKKKANKTQISPKRTALNNLVKYFQPKAYSQSQQSQLQPQSSMQPGNFMLDKMADQKTILCLDTQTVILVNPNSSVLTPIRIDQIPFLELDDTGKSVVEKFNKKLKYNETQLVLSFLGYDKKLKTLYLGVLKTDYATIQCLQQGMFPKGHSIYNKNFAKTGVLAPIITKADDHCPPKTHLFERQSEKKRFKLKNGLRSVAAGFLSTKVPPKTNIIIANAKKEAFEEVLGNNKIAIRPDNVFARLVSISIRYFNIPKKLAGNATKPLLVIEFVTPIIVPVSSEQLESQVLTHNLAQDAKEHEGVMNEDSSLKMNFEPINLKNPINDIKEQCSKYPGKFLWEPIVRSAHKYVHGDESKYETTLKTIEEIADKGNVSK